MIIKVSLRCKNKKKIYEKNEKKVKERKQEETKKRKRKKRQSFSPVCGTKSNSTINHSTRFYSSLPPPPLPYNFGSSCLLMVPLERSITIY
jgi:hypothetical protein